MSLTTGPYATVNAAEMQRLLTNHIKRLRAGVKDLRSSKRSPAVEMSDSRYTGKLRTKLDNRQKAAKMARYADGLEYICEHIHSPSQFYLTLGNLAELGIGNNVYDPFG